MHHSREIAFNTIGNVTTLFFQWLIIMLIPKITNFSEAGIFAVAISVCSILNHIATFSMREYQISDQHIHFSDSDFKAFRILTIALSFILILPVSLLFGYDTTEISVIVAYMVYRNCIHYAYLYSSSLQIANRLDAVGKDMVVEGVLSFVTFMGTYVYTHNLPLATFLMAVVGGGYFVLSEKYRYGRIVCTSMALSDARKAHMKKMFYIAVPLLGSLLAPTIITALPKLFLQNLEGNEIAGIFGTLSTPTIIIPTLAIAIFAPFILDFSDLARENRVAELRRRYAKLVVILLGLGAAFVLASLLLEEFAFVLLYGETIREYCWLFAPLVAGIVVYSVGTIANTVLLTMNQGRFAAISSFFAMAVGIVVCYVMVASSGIVGATYSLVLTYAVFGIATSSCVFLTKPKGVTLEE